VRFPRVTEKSYFPFSDPEITSFTSISLLGGVSVKACLLLSVIIWVDFPFSYHEKPSFPLFSHFGVSLLGPEFPCFPLLVFWGGGVWTDKLWPSLLKVSTKIRCELAPLALYCFGEVSQLVDDLGPTSAC
jgi:hypothetical protein